VRHAHLRVVQEVDHQPLTDLFRAVLGVQLALDMLAQPLVSRQQRHLGPPRTGISACLGD
jgi:hypothetical protein